MPWVMFVSASLIITWLSIYLLNLWIMESNDWETTVVVLLKSYWNRIYGTSRWYNQALSCIKVFVLRHYSHLNITTACHIWSLYRHILISLHVLQTRAWNVNTCLKCNPYKKCRKVMIYFIYDIESQHFCEGIFKLLLVQVQ